MKRKLCWVLLLALCLSGAAAHAETLTITFVGDTSIGDARQYVSNPSSYHSVVAERGMEWPLSLVADDLHSDDLTVANLEGSMTLRKKHRDIKYPLWIDPSHVDILRLGGIDVVNTANNHALDFMREGYQDTLEVLDHAGIAHFGTLSPPASTQVNKQAVVERKGIKVGFIGFTYPRDKDLPHIKQAAMDLREQGCALVVLSLHWGRETFLTPDPAQYAFAKSAMALDIDLIYGHHPHVVQPIALFEGKPVLFSTGNFTFGTMSKVDPSTGLFQVEYDVSGDTPRLSAIRVIPCETSGAGDYRPTPVKDDAQRREIFSKLTFQHPPEGFEELPERFLDTGEVRFERD